MNTLGWIQYSHFFIKFLNDYLTVVEDSYPIPNTRVNVSSEKHIGRDDGLHSLNGTGVKVMLEGKYFRNVDNVMPLPFCVLDIFLQRGHDAPLTTIQVSYNELLSSTLKKTERYRNS